MYVKIFYNYNWPNLYNILFSKLTVFYHFLFLKWLKSYKYELHNNNNNNNN